MEHNSSFEARQQQQGDYRKFWQKKRRALSRRKVTSEKETQKGGVLTLLTVQMRSVAWKRTCDSLDSVQKTYPYRWLVARREPHQTICLSAQEDSRNESAGRKMVKGSPFWDILQTNAGLGDSMAGDRESFNELLTHPNFGDENWHIIQPIDWLENKFQKSTKTRARLSNALRQRLRKRFLAIVGCLALDRDNRPIKSGWANRRCRISKRRNLWQEMIAQQFFNCIRCEIASERRSWL